MKTYKNLFEKIISFDNLLLAAKRASRGKNNKRNVMNFNFYLEDNLFQIAEQFKNKTYHPDIYNGFSIFDPKPRYISAAPFRDRVVHHALCNIIEPIFEKTFIFDSYANRKGKGTHKAILKAQRFIRTSDYVLKCDIKKYFPSIAHQILKQEIRWKIADPDTLWLIDTIIDASNEQEFVYDLFLGDDLISPLERRRGLPLGNLTSQFFANLYLNRFDHFIKENLQVKKYVRYVDDFMLAHRDLNFLKELKNPIDEFLAGLRLKIHPNKCHILKSKNGVSFLGQVIFPHYRIIKKENVRRFCKRVHRLNKKLKSGSIDDRKLSQSINGWRGHACQADSFKLRKALEQKFSDLGVKLI